MTDEKMILMQIERLPERLKREVLHYIEFLKEKHSEQDRKKRNRKAGNRNGKYELADDFSEPLEDFKEYM